MKKYLILKIGEANYNALQPVLLWTFFVLIPVAAFALFDYPIVNFLIDHPIVLWSCVWSLFAIFTGWAEAILFDKYSTINIHLSVNPHIFLNLLRLFVWLPIVPIIGFIHAGALVLAFPFIHDGAYYWKRNDLNNYIYLNGFWAKPSNTSTAVIDLNIYSRIALFLIAVTIQIFFK